MQSPLKKTTIYLDTFPKCKYNEYFKTTLPGDLERYDFVYIGTGIYLTSLKRIDFFSRLTELWISASIYLIKPHEKTSLSQMFNII